MSSSAYEELKNKVKGPICAADVLKYNIPHWVEPLPPSAREISEQMQQFAAMVNEFFRVNHKKNLP